MSFLSQALKFVAGFAMVGLIAATGAEAGGHGNLKISFVSAGWDGKTIPDNQVCQRFGGKGSTPSLKITGLPVGSHSVVLSFSDESYPPMDNGGHGILRYSIPSGSSEVVLPEVKGETDNLPKGVIVVESHRGSGWSGTGGAYLPPCSGGRNNSYYADIKVQDANGNDLNSTYIELGRY